MADRIGNKGAKDYHLEEAPSLDGFYIKGLSHCDWGMKNRLGKIFRPESGNTVMLAFDHGYIMGPTQGLERLDVTVPPLIPAVDVLMGTRGGIRSCISPNTGKAICVRCTFDSSVLHDDMSNGGGICCDVENAIRMNADCVAVQTFVGSEFGEKNSLDLLARTVNEATRYGIPVMGVVAVGKQMERTERFFLLAVRLLAESGAQIIKSYYCDGFERVAAACPVPIVVAGGKKLPEDQALTLAYRAISEGAHGVDMGRNIFQAEKPVAMARAIAKIVHEKYTDKEAYLYYCETEN